MTIKIPLWVYNTLWFACLRAWTFNKQPVFIRLANCIAHRVTYFPDRWYTQRVSYLDMFGLANVQIKSIWDVNGTWDNVVPVMEGTEETD